MVITSAAGSVTSSNAALTVVFSPQSQTNIAGATATFTATAFSPESLNYQWQKNGTNPCGYVWTVTTKAGQLIFSVARATNSFQGGITPCFPLAFLLPPRSS